MKFDALTTTLPARNTDSPPPKLYVSDVDAAQLTLTDESEKTLEEITTSALKADTNTAPPAALLAPGLHGDAIEYELLWLKLQCATYKLENCNNGRDEFEIRLGYVYESYTIESAPPSDKASIESPERELLKQNKHDKFVICT